MSKDIRKIIDKVKNFNKFISEGVHYIDIGDIKTEKEMILVDTKNVNDII